jgi:hypothetical protein
MIVVPDEARAIEVADDTKYGLGGSVNSRDLERGRRVPSRTEVCGPGEPCRAARLQGRRRLGECVARPANESGLRAWVQ